MPSAKVFPTKFQSVALINPFKNVAMLFAIFLAVPWIVSQGMLSNASFNFLPIITPISVKSAVLHASFNLSAILEIPLFTSTVSNIPPAPVPPLPPEPLPLPLESLSSSLLIWSNPSSVFLSFSFASAASFAADVPLFKLAA